MPELITEIPADEIETLKTNAAAAIAAVTNPVSAEQITRAKHVAAARKVITKIPDIIREQGSDKETSQRGFTVIMELEGDHFKRGSPFDGVPRTVENLAGMAAIVFEACAAAKLEPYIGKWWQFVGGDHIGLCVPLNDTGRAHAAESLKKLKR